jgi:ParB family transcriptional regulator, chromosome partitioning protein
VALRAVTHALVIKMFYDGYTDEHTSLGIKAHEPTFSAAIRTEIETSATGKKMAAVVKAWTKKLPKEPEQLWPWIEKQPKATVESLLAVCAAMSVDLVQVNGAEAKASATALTAALKLDMADHFTTTADNYFTRVPKKFLLEELGTAVSATTKRSLEGIKRDQLGKTLQTELKGRRWLPPILRTGKPGMS